MGHNSAVLGHPISTSFPHVDSWLTDPLVLGRQKFCQTVGEQKIWNTFSSKCFIIHDSISL